MNNFNITSISKPDTILNNPGKFFFQIGEDNEIKTSNLIQINKKSVDAIKTNILLIFKKISENLKLIANVDKDYYGTIISKLERFSNINNFTFRFPGLQVNSLNSQHVEVFSKYPDRLLICEKSDGVRFLLIQFENGKTIFLGRNLEFFIVDLTVTLPKSQGPKRSDWEIEHFIDGELIIDKSNKDKTNEMNIQKNHVLIGDQLHEVNFIVFDAVVLNGQNIGHLKFKRRLYELSLFFKMIKHQRFQTDAKNKFMGMFGRELHDTMRESLLKDNKDSAVRSSKFQIALYMKDYYSFDKIDYLYSQICKSLCHHNDGIILNYDDYPYYSGSADEIFKWKPSYLNSVDFEVSTYTPGGSKRRLYVLNVNESVNKLLPMTCLFFDKAEEKDAFEKEYEELSHLPNRIIAECYFDLEFNTDETMNYSILDQLEIIRKGDSLYLENYKFDMINEKRRQGVPTGKYAKGAWKFLRFRRDKQSSNHIKVFLSICKTIEENLTMDKIVDKIKQKYIVY
jgi:hypothetical protein